MTVINRTDATDEEFRARFERFGIFDEERKAVTAVDVDALDAARAALKEEFVSIGLDPGAGYYADALLPVVDWIANQRAAAELRKAVYALTITDRDTGIRIIGDRADALDPS